MMYRKVDGPDVRRNGVILAKRRVDGDRIQDLKQVFGLHRRERYIQVDGISLATRRRFEVIKKKKWLSEVIVVPLTKRPCWRATLTEKSKQAPSREELYPDGHKTKRP